MKGLKRFAACMLIIVLVVAMIPAAFATEEVTDDTEYTEVKQTVYAITSVNVRSGPSTKYSVLGVLSSGDSIQRTAIGDNGWSKVIYKDQEAYMYSAYLSTSKPTALQAQMDYSNLTRQIAIANGLEEGDYTRETWSVLEEALENANDAMDSTKQEKVDEAAEELKNAIAALLKVDYTALETALADAREFVATQEMYAQWTELVEATAKGKVLLESGDQLAADAAAAELNKILTELKSQMAQMGDPQVVTKEVEVQVFPTEDFCNISKHLIWPVLYAVSLTLNVVLVVLVVLLYRKRKNQIDDMPLVDYNIDDDI